MGREAQQQQQQQVSFTVEQLVAVNPYNPDILPDLENYVNEQVLSQTYSLDANLCLLRLYQQMEDQFKTLIVLSHYLETGRFRHFWDEAAKHRNIVEAVPGFEQAIQSFAIHVLSLTYQKIPRTVLAEAINLKGLSLDKFLEHQKANCGWILEGDQSTSQLIVLPPNEFNHPELKKNVADSIPLEHITRIFPILG
ncbi:eukaryotic translation initiation factor 3 subunit K [Citrus sinensis]|uniref:Eukaryotic translation initiation factor 3 subunit K n=1 Tax=Citrus sinensis TaxID=2711 RepID=A0ACB8P437_CITSI|nr:eukaryotic translation initiation factor 3 subunit K isoform X2 [Citrus sinensis]KAH9652893.1 eukaryotic translation initiation factor 3 subunit K [Citrus sinensis]KAH9804822.1 eukaryotic translation initiation factor 3 subunit K [Citrus sinensis]